jgi:hypothetical protein
MQVDLTKDEIEVILEAVPYSMQYWNCPSDYVEAADSLTAKLLNAILLDSDSAGG